MESRFAKSLALAGLVHAALLVAALGVRPPPLPVETSPLQEVEVGVEWPEPVPPAPASIRLSGSELPLAPRPALPPRHVDRLASRGPEAGPQPPVGLGVAPPLPIASAEPSPAGEPGEPFAPRRPVDLGLGGAVPLWARERAQSERAPGGAFSKGGAAAGGLAEGLAERDRARGMGRGGVVATGARAAALAKGPNEGRATFVVLTDREGKVRSVSVADPSADAALWNEAARYLRGALASKRLRVPPGAAGLRVAVLVESKIQMPSGAKPGKSVEVQGAGAAFDVADIGAHPSRVVSCRIVSETVL